MNEMQLLEEFRAVVAPPDPETLTQARARVLAGAAAGQASRRARSPRRPDSWPKLALTGLAAATALTITVALAALGGAPSHPGATGTDARELAYRVAGIAAAQPNVRPGQWVYRQVKVITFGQHPVMGARWRYQSWTTADGTRTAVLLLGKVRFMPCPPGRALPRGGCQPLMFELPGDQAIPVTYAQLSSLPRSPAALDRYLASLPLRGAGPAPFREFAIISNLLVAYVMPPALTAELYRALGDIPGVTVDQHAVDVAGRVGIGFQITVPGLGADSPARSVAQLILSPRTYHLMAGQELDTNQRLPSVPRHTLYGTAILKTALVSGPGILP